MRLFPAGSRVNPLTPPSLLAVRESLARIVDREVTWLWALLPWHALARRLRSCCFRHSSPRPLARAATTSPRRGPVAAPVRAPAEPTPAGRPGTPLRPVALGARRGELAVARGRTLAEWAGTRTAKTTGTRAGTARSARAATAPMACAVRAIAQVRASRVRFPGKKDCARRTRKTPTRTRSALEREPRLIRAPARATERARAAIRILPRRAEPPLARERPNTTLLAIRAVLAPRRTPPVGTTCAVALRVCCHAPRTKTARRRRTATRRLTCASPRTPTVPRARAETSARAARVPPGSVAPRRAPRLRRVRRAHACVRAPRAIRDRRA